MLESIAAVYGQNRAGDVVRFVRAEKGGGVADVVGNADAAPGKFFPLRGDRFIVVVIALSGGVDPSGFDAVDVDVVFGKFSRHGLHHGIECGFGGAVGNTPGVGNAGENAGDKNNFPGLLLFDKVAAKKLADVKSTKESRLKNVFKVFRVVVEKGLAPIECRDADETVDGSEFGEGGLHRCFASLPGKGVGLHGETGNSQFPNRFRGSGKFFASGLVGDHERGTCTGQLAGTSESDSTGSPGDEGNFSFEFHDADCSGRWVEKERLFRVIVP